MQTIGNYLKSGREARNIPLSEVARSTKISKWYLDCLEKDEFDKIPGHSCKFLKHTVPDARLRRGSQHRGRIGTDGAGRAARQRMARGGYRGIRPAFGYPACPDHTEKQKLFTLLDAPGLGISLTSSYAMAPAASVSGIYLAHPQARYFTLGRIGRDQVEDYAGRKGIKVAEIERWLAPNLGYDPGE